MEHLHDQSKEKIAKALLAQEKASRHLRECLTVQIKGKGLTHSSAIRSAEAAWNAAVRDVKEIASRSVRPEGLLATQDVLDEAGLGEPGDQIDIGRGATVTRLR